MSIRDHYVYWVHDDQGELLYVGCTKSPVARHRSHMRGDGDGRGHFDPYAASWRFRGPYTKPEARAIEAQQIKELSPVWNANSPGRDNWAGRRNGIAQYVARRRQAVPA